jgi:hypothetical protein
LPVPRVSEARPFYRAARHRFEDAELLFEQERFTGAVYLAGYCVECMLKALGIVGTAASRRPALVKEFRGAKAHDYGWLKKKCSVFWKGGLPSGLAMHFSRVNTWSTELRYDSRATREGEAREFLDSAAAIMKWIDSRL